MEWYDKKTYIEVYPPKEFSFDECIAFLSRSSQEVLHQIKDGSIYKLLKIEDSLVLCRIRYEENAIKVDFPDRQPEKEGCSLVAKFIWEWFDLEADLKEFYQLASNDGILKGIAKSYSGLRIMCIPDLFEALVWAVLGQQINLTFAYTLKKRFVERFGESLMFAGETYWVFPTYEKIASLQVDDLRELQFTVRKAEYIVGIAEEMVSGNLSKEKLLHKRDFNEVKKSLVSIRGIGDWTANYVMMKCLHDTSSLPIADVGLHNALKNILGLERKPSIEEIKEYAANWSGWEAYATFYLWRSLYDEAI